MWFNAPKQVYDLFEACVMSDGSGDASDPQAYGVFYDENEAYLFQLSIKKKNDWNDYTSSKFLANLGKRPVAANKDGPFAARIKQILDSRHDLFTKFQARDVVALENLLTKFKASDPSEEAGFDDEAKKTSKVQPAKATASTAPTASTASKQQTKPIAKPKDDEAFDLLEEEAPATKPTTGRPKSTSVPTPTAVPTAKVDDVPSDDIESLLNELDNQVEPK
jgi:hypothetical protein